jgi:hypothetical protein
VFIELVDQLRCIQPHADSWLVASAERMSGRDVIEGALGCPVCRARYAVHDGVAYFADPPPARAAPGTAASAGAAGGDEVMRAAALLGLGEPGGFVLLGGAWAALARPLAALAAVQVVVLNPPEPLAAGEGVNVVEAPTGTLPLAASALRGAALGDAEAAAPELVARVVAALRPRARLVAPVWAATPGDVTELARDARHWVGERTGVTSAPVALGVARRTR